MTKGLLHNDDQGVVYVYSHVGYPPTNEVCNAHNRACWCYRWRWQSATEVLTLLFGTLPANRMVLSAFFRPSFLFLMNIEVCSEVA